MIDADSCIILVDFMYIDKFWTHFINFMNVYNEGSVTINANLLQKIEYKHLFSDVNLRK